MVASGALVYGALVEALVFQLFGEFFVDIIKITKDHVMIPFSQGRTPGDRPLFQTLFGLFRSTVHGDARWMSSREMRRFFARTNDGLVISPRHRMSRADSFANLALVAPTGSGKTTRFVIPNLLKAEGSVVVTDPSGELYERTSGHLRDRGFDIRCLAPTDLEHSVRFNPLKRCRTPQEIRQLATTLAQNAGNQDPFWTITATNLLYLSLSAIVAVDDVRHRNLGNLRWLLNHLGTGNVAVHRFMSRHLEDERLFSEYLAFCAQDPKVMASILASARASLELWSDPDICRLTASDNTALENLRTRKTAIYLVVPEHRIRYFSILLNLFYSASFALCLQDVKGPSVLPVYFFLDEFGNLGRVADFASIVTTLRKRRCSLSIILQELSQLTSVYGQHEARTIFAGGCGTKLFFSGLDLETSRYIEGMLGQSTEYDTTYGGFDERSRTVGVPLMRADHARMMRGREAVLISGGHRPVKIRMPPFFDIPSMERVSKKPPASFAPDYAEETLEYIDFGKAPEEAEAA